MKARQLVAEGSSILTTCAILYLNRIKIYKFSLQ